jgi:hypothetical protein
MTAFKGVNQIVHISTNIGGGCEHCSFPIGLDKFAESVNHYIEQHGYKLLHIGTESSRDDDDRLWHHTVAVVGKDAQVPKKPASRVSSRKR